MEKEKRGGIRGSLEKSARDFYSIREASLVSQETAQRIPKQIHVAQYLAGEKRPRK